MRDIGGEVFYAPLRLRIRDGKFREPDLLLVRDADDPRCRDDYWLGADLVMEVVSPDNPDRDMVDKRLDYAEAGIPEYWIVNPLDETVTVLFLADGAYRERGVFQPGAHAGSAVLPGFSVNVQESFDAARTRNRPLKLIMGRRLLPPPELGIRPGRPTRCTNLAPATCPTPYPECRT